MPLETRLQPDTRQKIAELAVGLIVEHMLQMEGQPQTLRQMQVVVPLHQLFILSRGKIGLRVSDPPRILRIENDPGFERHAEAVEAIVSIHGLGSSISAEYRRSRRELLIDADAKSCLIRL